MLGNDLQQFLEQPFVSAMLGMLCFLSLLLVAVIVLLVYVRRQKALRAATASSNSPGFAASDHDMPDMNLLVSAPQATASPIAPARTPRKGAYQIKPGDGQVTEAVEVLTILRDVMDGTLIIQMGDRVYRNVHADADFRDRFTKLMNELGQMSRPTAIPADSNPASTAASPEQLAEMPQTPPPTPVAPKPPQPAATGGAIPGVLPSFKLDDQPMGQKRGRKLELPPIPEINIAGAIESYLQHKLRQSGELPEHSIHIYPAPDGSLRIEVDGQFHEAVSDIDDPVVREYLAQTIQEWQEHH
jgi:hypothetical protein